MRGAAWLTLLMPLAGWGGNALDGDACLWAPFLEWRVNNTTVSGDPFDLVATTTFEHVATGATNTTEWFYRGSDEWAVRFAGTRLGSWQATTESSDPDLNGIAGTVEVTDCGATPGFLGQSSNGEHSTWARSVGTGAPQAFVPQLVMYRSSPADYFQQPARIEDDIDRFLGDHGFNGFHVESVAGWWFDLDGDRRVESTDADPDSRTFEALETLITKTHAAGGHVHIWPWGDQARRWTPTELQGGINGVHRSALPALHGGPVGRCRGMEHGPGFRSGRVDFRRGAASVA